MNITPSPNIIDTLEKQMEAERRKRLRLLWQTLKRQHHCMARGTTEAVNISEGERQNVSMKHKAELKRSKLLPTLTNREQRWLPTRSASPVVLMR